MSMHYAQGSAAWTSGSYQIFGWITRLPQTLWCYQPALLNVSEDRVKFKPWRIEPLCYKEAWRRNQQKVRPKPDKHYFQTAESKATTQIQVKPEKQRGTIPKPRSNSCYISMVVHNISHAMKYAHARQTLNRIPKLNQITFGWLDPKTLCQIIISQLVLVIHRRKFILWRRTVS